MTIADYRKEMVTNGWGDNLMIALLARCFDKAITVISKDSARTFFADGHEADGVVQESIWIAHHSEFHYYGVLRAGVSLPAKDSLGRTGGFSGNCPLCTTEWDCGTCIYQRSLSKQSEAAVSPMVSTSQPLADQSSTSSSKPAVDPVALQAPVDAESERALEAADSEKRRVTGKRPPPRALLPPPSMVTLSPKPKGTKSSALKKAPNVAASVDKRRLCGNCGVRGHQAVTCLAPCFACGGAHKYFECDDPQLHHEARRQAARNRVEWTGFGSKAKVHKGRGGHEGGRCWEALGEEGVRPRIYTEQRHFSEACPSPKMPSCLRQVPDVIACAVGAKR